MLDPPAGLAQLLLAEPGAAGRSSLRACRRIYVYARGNGEDTIVESASDILADTIEFQAGITFAQLTLTKLSNNDLVIDIAGGGRIVVNDQFKSYGGGKYTLHALAVGKCFQKRTYELCLGMGMA